MLKKFGMQLKIAAAGLTMEDVVVERPAGSQRVVETKRSDFLYFRARAISAGDQGPRNAEGCMEPNPNGNGDYFPKAELEKSYNTFVGSNLFLNHESDHPIKSIGKIIDAYAVEDPETGEYYVECLSKIDKKLHPEIARKVETGELDKVSMGCSCESSMCSICGTAIHSDQDRKCDHLSPSGLLKTYTASIDLPEYGIQKGHPAKAFAINSGLTFNELSIVNVPADQAAIIKTIISNMKSQIAKKGSLDISGKEILAQFETVLAKLDEATVASVKAEFCGCPMPEKKTIDVDEILAKLNGSEYERLQEHIAKKQNRDVPEKKAVQAGPTEKEMSWFKDLLMKADNSIAGKIYKATLKRLASEAQTPEEKPVEAAMEKDAYIEESDGKYCVKSPKNKSWSGGCYESRPAAEKRLQEVEMFKHMKSSIHAEFKKEGELAKSTWTLFDGDKALVTATLGQIWGTELKANAEWASGTEYGTALVERFLDKDNGGVAKMAELLGVEADKSGDTSIKTTYEIGGDHPGSSAKGPTAPAGKDLKTEYAIGGDKPGASQKGPAAPKGKETKTEYAIGKPDVAGASKINPANPAEKDAKKSAEGVEADYKAGDHLLNNMPKSEVKDADKAMNDLDASKKVAHPMDSVAPALGTPDVAVNPTAAMCQVCKMAMPQCTCAKAAAPMMDAPMDAPVADPMAPETSPIPPAAPAVDPMAPPMDPMAPAAPEAGSVFDKLQDKIMLGENYEAQKDLKTKEIIVMKDGKEVKRLPDGFGDDVPTVMKLLQEIMNIKPEGEKKEFPPKKDDKPAEEKSEKEPKEEKSEEPKEEKEDKPKEEKSDEFPSEAFASQKAELTKQAEELKKREEALKTAESKLNAGKFASSLNARQQKCQKIIETMLAKDMLDVNEDDIATELAKGAKLLDARHMSQVHAINAQIRALIAMDDNSLEAFAKSVEAVKKTAVQKSASRLPTLSTKMDWSAETSMEEDIRSIFSSMGTLKGK